MLPSLHGAVLVRCRQPTDALQESLVQRLPSSQFGAGPPTQPPPPHVSLVVQRLPSLQGALFAGNTHPWDGLQESSVHGFPSLQTGAVPALHTLLTQVSTPLQ